MQVVFARINCFTHLTLLAVLLRLQAVLEDHFREISLERPSDGPIMSSSSLEYVQHHSGGHWPTLISEVVWVGPAVVPARILLKNSCRSLIQWSSHSFLMCHAPVLLATSRVLIMQIVLACTSPTHYSTDGPSGTASAGHQPHGVVSARISLKNSCRSFIEWSSHAYIRRKCVSSISHISRLDRANCLCMYKAHVAELVVRPRLQVVREDHFQKVSSEQPSDGLIVVSSSLVYVQHYSGGYWLTSVYEVHRDHVSACLVVPHPMCSPCRFCYGPCKDFVEDFLQVIFLMVTTCVR